jgi:hypothetical protein
MGGLYSSIENQKGYMFGDDSHIGKENIQSNNSSVIQPQSLRAMKTNAQMNHKL